MIRKLFAQDYEKAIGRAPIIADEEIMVDAGKALAAFQETLVSARTPFDEFRDGLERGNLSKTYSLAEQRGVRIFGDGFDCDSTDLIQRCPTQHCARTAKETGVP